MSGETLSLNFCGRAARNFILVMFGKSNEEGDVNKNTTSASVNIVEVSNTHIRKLND